MIQVKGSRNLDSFPELRGIKSAIKEAAKGTNRNSIFAVLLGGAHSKGLENEDSDWDITVYYLPNIKNLIALRKETFHFLSDERFRQISEHPTVYECGGEKVELTVAPVRTIGSIIGKELYRNIAKHNMKTIHDFIKDYSVDGHYGAKDIRDFLIDGFIYSVNAIDGYFRGYMTSQLKAPGRMKDYDKRERASYEKNDIKPVTKVIVNGLYIGLSGLALLERQEIYRDTVALAKEYEHLFTDTEIEFIKQVLYFKKYRKPISESVTSFLTRAREFRNDAYEKLVITYDAVKERSKMGLPTPADTRNNLSYLDALLREWLKID